MLLVVLSLFNVMTLNTKVKLCTSAGDSSDQLFVGVMKYPGQDKCYEENRFVYSQFGRFKSMVDTRAEVCEEESWMGPVWGFDTNLQWGPVRMTLPSKGGALNDVRTSQNPHLLKVPSISRCPHWGPSSIHITWTSGEQTNPKQHGLCSAIRWGM